MKNKTILIAAFYSVLISLLGFSSCDKNSPQPDEIGNDSTTISKTVVYTESSEAFPNPERGFLHLNSVFSEGSSLSTSSLSQLRNSNISLVWRLYYFEQFKNSDLSEAQLSLIETDMTNIRAAGLKCVLRFAYTNNSDDGTDAPIDVVEGHLDQLKPLFENNADVIAFVNAGFIGLWGEWHSSSNNLTSLENQIRVVDKLLEVLPKTIKIQLRTPKQKTDVFGTSAALTSEEGYSDADIARVGHHNDCFMASYDDYGTYTNPTVDKNYISQEALYVPTGGETCPPSGIDPADCEEARNTMSLLKWTYLNLDWYKPILDGWRSEGCFTEFERDMGYRLVLQSSTADTLISNQDLWNLKIDLTNIGWAPIYNKKEVSIILKSQDQQYVFSLTSDIRRAIPNESFVIEQELDLSDVNPDNYDVYLKIADQFASIADRPEYCIQLANESVWDDTHGWNSLQRTVAITE